MKCFKRCTAYFICICLVLASFIPATLAQTAYDYTQVAQTLLRIGVLKEINADLDSTLTRGEMARMVSVLAGGSLTGSSETVFSDVAADNRFLGDINLLYASGIMNGYGDGTFRPDNPVTMNEALKIFTTLLGYGPITERWGGYPVAHQRAAYESKLTKDVAAWGDEPLTYGEAIQLLYNTVTADMLQVTGLSADSQTIERRGGETLLTQQFDIYQHEGVLEATGITSLTGGKTLSEEKILVGNEVFVTAEDADFSEFLGYYVNCYYKGTGSDREAVLLVKDANKNNETIIAAEDIDSVTRSGNITVGYFNPNGKVTNHNIDADVDLIYNGKAYPGFSYSDLNIKSGYLTLIDNDADSKTDVIIVTEFDTLVVKSVSEFDKKVYGVYGNTVVLDEEEQEKVGIIRATGEECTISDIKQDNVLSVAQSKDGEVVLCILENRGILGTITALEEENGKIVSCVVNDNIYDLTKEFTDELETDVLQQRSFVLGKSLRFVITHDGKIAYSFEGAEGEQYGYLLAAEYGANPFNDEDGEFLIYSQNGELLEIKGAKKIETNGGKYTAEDTINQWDAESETGITDGEGEIVQQLVKYQLNSKGELDKLYYANEATDDFENETFYCTTISANPNTYRSTAKAIGEYTISTDTALFLIEKRGTDGKVDSEGIRVIPNNNLADGANYTFTAYDSHYYKAPKAVVIDIAMQDAVVGLGDDVFVISRKLKVMNDGTEQDKITGFVNGKAAEYTVDEDCSVDSLEEGDAILLGINSDGEVSKYAVICDISEDITTDTVRFPRGGSRVSSAVFSAVAGNIADYKSNALGVRSISSATGEYVLTGHSIVSSSYFYLYDTTAPYKSRVSVAGADEMVAETVKGNGSRVVVASRYASVRAVIIIK